MNRQINLRVRRVRQTSGPGYVVIFDAVVALLESGESTITLTSPAPADALPEQVDIAAAAILRGIQFVLAPRGCAVTVTHLVIHPVDFSAKAFEQWTATDFAAALGETT